MSEKTVTALVLTPEGEVETLALSDYTQLCTAVGGLIDVVSTRDLPDVVGYVNDEGLLIGLAPNALASMLFSRPLVGPCVLVGCLSPTGDYDGENYDVPARFMHPTLAEIARALVNDPSVMESLTEAIASLDLAPTITAVTDEEFDRWLATGETPNSDDIA